MTYLSDIIQDRQTKAFEKYGAFFCFSNAQFEERAQKGVKYCSLGAGMVCPKENAKQLLQELSKIVKEGRQEDKKLHGLENIIERELCNYECYYTGNIDEAVEALKGYGVTAEQVRVIYNLNRNKHYED